MLYLFKLLYATHNLLLLFWNRVNIGLKPVKQTFINILIINHTFIFVDKTELSQIKRHCTNYLKLNCNILENKHFFF